MNPSYRYFGQTHAGRVRPNNEDAFLIREDLGLVVLADGMGGYQAGEVASHMAIHSIEKSLGAWLSAAPATADGKGLRQAIESSVESANADILHAAQHNPDCHGMGTTLVVAVLHGPLLVLAHVGDSRCYLYRRKRLTQLTKDHSLVQERVDAGLMTQKQAETSAHKNVVTRALGVDMPVQVDIAEHRLVPGDSYLLCSDGLTDVVNDRQIAKILDNEEAIGSRAQALINTANAYGGPDNISVVLIETGTITKKRNLFSRLL